MDATLKGSLISTGDEAFLSLTQQIQHMLDVIDFYSQRYQPTGESKHDSLAFEHEQMKPMIETLGSLPYQLADVLRRWKHDEPRILSRLGVQLTLINEIWATLEVVTLFFVLRHIELDPYNRTKAETAVFELQRVNNCMP